MHSRSGLTELELKTGIGMEMGMEIDCRHNLNEKWHVNVENIVKITGENGNDRASTLNDLWSMKACQGP